ncbi:MAG: hypothetical protein ACI9G1_003773 [Pirellulaceae bacterium]
MNNLRAEGDVSVAERVAKERNLSRAEISIVERPNPYNRYKVSMEFKFLTGDPPKKL